MGVYPGAPLPGLVAKLLYVLCTVCMHKLWGEGRGGGQRHFLEVHINFVVLVTHSQKVDVGHLNQEDYAHNNYYRGCEK